MKLVTVAGPPSSGKTSVILQTIQALGWMSGTIGVVKFDCLTSFDHERYQQADIPVRTGFSGRFCPDHFFASNIEDATHWGNRENFELLITESAGLCNRCSPYIRNIPAVCVIDCLSGINTPRKIGPMLKFADMIVVTKGDIVSQAEREVFAFNIRQINAKAQIMFVNGITGQGAYLLAEKIKAMEDIFTVRDEKLRFAMPASVCSYCLGETRIGEEYQNGTLKKINFFD